MSQIPSSGAGHYPATTMGTEAYSKLPLSGAPNFTTEPQDMSLPTSMAPSVPISMVPNDQQQPPMRPQYTYVHSTGAPPQLSVHTSPINPPGHALSIPRYVDNPRPSKSPRHTNHPSIHSTASMVNHGSSPDYRYGSYAPVNPGSNDVPQPPYHPEPTGPPSATARDYYPSPATWTTTAGEPSSSVAYTNSDGRSFSFSQDQYKSPAEGTSPVKPDSSQPPIPYNGGPRGSFDAMNQYSWSGN